MANTTSQKVLRIPIEIVSPTDVGRVVRELEAVDEQLRQAEIRQTQPTLPQLSKLLDSVITTNNIDLMNTDQRERLVKAMTTFSKVAPVVHISFSTDPPGSYLQSVVKWLRENIDMSILVRVGLQPSIGAGCVVRTTNQSFDFSLRQFFQQKRTFFARKLHEAVSEQAQATPTTATAEAEATEASA